MNTIEILYADVLWVEPEDTSVPVVRYADHCAAMEEKERLRANAVKRCAGLLAELERITLACERIQDELVAMRKTYLERYGNPLPEVAGRWDTLPKAL